MSVQETDFDAMRNTYGAVWEASQLPPFPLDLRLTDSLGHAVVAAYAPLLNCAHLCTSICDDIHTSIDPCLERVLASTDSAHPCICCAPVKVCSKLSQLSRIRSWGLSG